MNFPFSQTTRPPVIVTSAVPVTLIPSNTLKSTAWWWVYAEITLSALGFQTTTSASAPALIIPLFGYMLNICAAAVEVTLTKSIGDKKPLSTA